jgi:hypothetical protein
MTSVSRISVIVHVESLGIFRHKENYVLYFAIKTKVIFILNLFFLFSTIEAADIPLDYTRKFMKRNLVVLLI